FRPWAMNMLIQSCGMTPSARNPAPPEATPDVYLVSTARATGRPVHGFETWQQHIDAFAGIPEEAQLDVLRNGLDAAVA
ncbi:TraB/GumN family protein, partial [Pseudomonas aeruginosa]|uniref:TraB/GumN family protein n=1 Tax=Pseudomonas aeruginosa TaxID=287 RepID=UPI002F93D2E8